MLPPPVQDPFNKVTTTSSTAFEDDDGEAGRKVFVGSKTVAAPLEFVKENGWADYKETRDSANTVQAILIPSGRQAVGVFVRLGSRLYRVYLKGTSEILMGRCTRHIVVERGSKQAGDVETVDIGGLARDNIQRTIIFYANQTPSTVAISSPGHHLVSTQSPSTRCARC